MKKLIVMAFALMLGALAYGGVGRVNAAVFEVPAAAKVEAAKSEATKVRYYRYRRYRYYRYYRWRRCTRWHYIGRGYVRRWCRYY